MTKPLEPAELVEKATELLEAAKAARAADHQVVLAIGAHPDDVEIGIGGILLRHSDAGHDVNILTLTGGERGGAAEERAQESLRAAELLGGRLFHEDLADTEVGDRGETIGAIKKVIDEVGARTIYTHTSNDVHQDHRNVHSATLVAARGLPRIYCYQAPSTTVDFRPTRFVGIDDVIDRKLEAIAAFSLADGDPRLPRRGAAAGDGPLLGPLRAVALRRAARGRARGRGQRSGDPRLPGPAAARHPGRELSR